MIRYRSPSADDRGSRFQSKSVRTDSLLEGAGFELSVPRERGYGFEPLATDSPPEARFASDSLLEEDGFEPSVPR
jgi:hypothetical protein